MPESRPPISQDPSLLPFLPLLYVAWADGALEDDEQATRRAHLAAQPALTPAARAALLEWLDPSRPPTPSTLVEWLEQLRTISSAVDPTTVRTLGDLGLAIAGDAADERTVEALRTLAGDLGLTRTPLNVLSPAEPAAPAPTRTPVLDVAALRRLLDGPDAPARDEIREFLASRRPPHDLATPELRVLCHDWLRELGERGIGRHAFPGVTTDGGATWQKVLYVSDSTGAVDVELDRQGRVLYSVTPDHGLTESDLLSAVGLGIAVWGFWTTRRNSRRRRRSRSSSPLSFSFSSSLSASSTCSRRPPPRCTAPTRPTSSSRSRTRTATRRSCTSRTSPRGP